MFAATSVLGPLAALGTLGVTSVLGPLGALGAPAAR